VTGFAEVSGGETESRDISFVVLIKFFRKMT
jgi:hypothetical protein